MTGEVQGSIAYSAIKMADYLNTLLNAFGTH